MTQRILPPDRPQTLAEFLWYCREYQRDIYFRAERGGRWRSVSLAALTPQEYGENLARLIEENRPPVRVRRDEEEPTP